MDVYSDGVRASQSNKVIVGFGDASFSWNPCGDRSFTLQVQGDLVFNPGMNLIIGPTGAGRSQIYVSNINKGYHGRKNISPSRTVRLASLDVIKVFD